MHVFFNEAFSRAFKARILQVRADITSEALAFPARYSVLPPSEEARNLCRAIFPSYAGGSFNTNVASGLTRVLAEMNRIPIEELHPLLYVLGHNATQERVALSLTECVGLVTVAEEFLPPSLFCETAQDREPHPRLRPWAVGLNRPSFQIFDGAHFSPTLIPRSIQNVPPGTEVEIPAGELLRAGETEPYRAIEIFRSAYRYAGGVRYATVEEIEAIFRTHFLPGSWYGFPGVSVVDYFSMLGVINQYNNAQLNAPALPASPGAPAMPTGANATNVVGRQRQATVAPRMGRPSRATAHRYNVYNTPTPSPESSLGTGVVQFGGRLTPNYSASEVVSDDFDEVSNSVG